MSESRAPLPSEMPEPIVPISWLLGKWVGVGLGTYPTIEDFRFGQEVTFTNDGRPFLHYESKSAPPPRSTGSGVRSQTTGWKS